MARGRGRGHGAGGGGAGGARSRRHDACLLSMSVRRRRRRLGGAALPSGPRQETKSQAGGGARAAGGRGCCSHRYGREPGGGPRPPPRGRGRPSWRGGRGNVFIAVLSLDIGVRWRGAEPVAKAARRGGGHTDEKRGAGGGVPVGTRHDPGK